MLTGDKFIFISFENGGGGHRLGRVLCTLPNNYWYSHPDNGINPWNVWFETTNIRQRKVSRYHFDRLVPNGMLPPTHDYVSKFIPDEDEYYSKYYYPAFEKMNGYEIIKHQNLVLCSHALPSVLLSRFPDAKVLNIVGDADNIAERYLKTTAIFPAYLKLKWLNGENTEYGKKLAKMAEAYGNDFTVRDIWCHDNFNDRYSDRYKDMYETHVYNMIRTNMEARKMYLNPNSLTVRAKDYKLIKEFLNG